MSVFDRMMQEAAQARQEENARQCMDLLKCIVVYGHHMASAMKADNVNIALNPVFVCKVPGSGGLTILVRSIYDVRRIEGLLGVVKNSTDEIRKEFCALIDSYRTPVKNIVNVRPLSTGTRDEGGHGDAARDEKYLVDMREVDKIYASGLAREKKEATAAKSKATRQKRKLARQKLDAEKSASAPLEIVNEPTVEEPVEPAFPDGM